MYYNIYSLTIDELIKMQQQRPKSGGLIYVKDMENNRIMLVDEVINVGTGGFFTFGRHCFNFWGEPIGATANVYMNCLAFAVDETNKRFFEKLYYKK